MRIGIAADHAGFALKKELAKALSKSGHEIVDFGPSSLNPEDDYPDYVVPLARNVASGEVERGMAICGSGVGACVTANKVKGVRAALVHDVFSVHQAVGRQHERDLLRRARAWSSASLGFDRNLPGRPF
jgi:ribose 5-phosphate isomerase B